MRREEGACEQRMKVSVLLLTFNEEGNLPRCLNALEWCDDIIVVDFGSTDRTVGLARQGRARVLHRPFDDFASQRNFGLSEGLPKHEWVLHLDADEVVTEIVRPGTCELAAAGQYRRLQCAIEVDLARSLAAPCGHVSSLPGSARTP